MYFKIIKMHFKYSLFLIIPKKDQLRIGWFFLNLK